MVADRLHGAYQEPESLPPGALGSPPPGSNPGAPPPSGTFRSTDYSTALAPLVVLAVALPMILFATLLVAVARDVGGEPEVLFFFLGSSGAAAAATVGMVAGLVAIRRPASSLSSVGTIVLGGFAVLFGLAATFGSINFDLGLEALVDRLVTSTVGPAGALLLLGAVAVLVGVNAKNPGEPTATIPVFGLVGGAFLVGCNGIVREVVGLGFNVGFFGRVSAILSTFSLESALLVLVAALLLVLHPGPNTPWQLVAGAAGGILFANLVASLFAAVAEDGRFGPVSQDPSRTSAAIALAAIAVALTFLSQRPSGVAVSTSS